MNRFIKYISLMVIALCLICVMVMPSFAAVVSQDITEQQMAVILDVDDFRYISGAYVGYQSSNNFTYSKLTSNNGIDIFARQAVSGQTIGTSADQRNLLNPASFDVDTYFTEAVYFELQLAPNTQYTLSTNLPSWQTNAGKTGYLWITNANVDITDYRISNVAYNSHNFTFTTDSTGIAWIWYRNKASNGPNIDFSEYLYQLNIGPSALSYLPYHPYIGFNIPLFLSGFDSITVQFAIAGSFMNSNLMQFDSAVLIDDSIATPVEVNYLGTVSTTDYSVYPFQLYQVTIEDDVDLLQFRFLPLSIVSDSSFTLAFGLTAVSVVADDSVIQGISGQIMQINTKIESLIDAIDDLQSTLDGLVIQNGDVVTNLQEINNIANSIEENQELMLYLTENEELVVQNITTSNTNNTTKINQYISIMQQYSQNNPTVNNVENIIESGVPSAEAIAVAVAPIQSLFDATWFIGILATVGAVALLSYVLFGKR